MSAFAFVRCNVAFVRCNVAFYITGVQMACVACFRAVGYFACACLLAFFFRVIVYGFASVCCEVAFHIQRVCRLHVSFSFLIWACLFERVCLFCVRCCIRWPLLQGRVSCYMRVLVACVVCFRAVGLFVRACLFRVWLCMRLLLFVARLHSISHVCRLQLCFACVILVCLFVLVCMYCV